MPEEPAMGGKHDVNGARHRESGGSVRRWPLGFIGLPAAVAIWSGWVNLGTMCGFGVVRLLPGIDDHVRLNTAITLPVGVEAYAAYAIGAWLSPGAPDRARAFAKRSAFGAIILGMTGQAAYHLLVAYHVFRPPWPIVVLVACLPVLVLGLATALTHLLWTAPSVAADATQDIPAVPAGSPVAGAAGVPVTAAGRAPKATPAPSAQTAPGTREGAPGGTGIRNPAPATPARRFRSLDELVREGREAEERAGRRLGVKVLRAHLSCKYEVARAVAQALHPEGAAGDGKEVAAR